MPKSLDLNAAVDGVLISHPHQDHYGLLEDVPAGWPIYCGAATERLIRLSSAIFGKELPHAFHPWKSGAAFQIGPFTVTPFLIDHSAFDAYMLLIEVHGKRVLYSGDFRTHGRKSALTRRLMAAPPKNLDVLLMEGTNLGSDKPCVTESNLEDAFVDLFRSTAGRVFVAWSAQNVDRTVTLYRACLKAGRTLVVDLYTAEVMEALAEFGKLPRPGWNNLKVVVTSAFARMYRRTGREAFVEHMVPHGISAAKLAETPEKVGGDGAPFAHPRLRAERRHAESRTTPGAGRCGADIWRMRMVHWSASGSKTEEAAPTTFIRAAMRLPLFCDRSPTR